MNDRTPFAGGPDAGGGTGTMEPARRFTPELADRMLPLVRSIVTDLIEKSRELRGRRALAADPEVDPDVVALQHELVEIESELAELGCRYRTWTDEEALVDFPARVAGHDAFLSWKSDEPRVEWWVPAGGSFADRKPLPDRD